MTIKKGSIKVEVGAQVSAYELAAAEYLKTRGHEVVVIAPNRIARQRTADMRVDGVLWELKTPLGNSSRTIQGVLRRSKRQSSRVIIDCRFTRRTDGQLVQEARTSFQLVRSIERLWIIQKDGILTDLRK